MSILLDALRKSENSQKPVAPPDIHSNDIPLVEKQTINPSLLAILLVVALLVIGWLVWRQYQPDTAVYRPPVELPGGKPIASVPADAGTDSQQVNPVQEKSAQQKPPVAGAARPRTPVETYQPEEQELTEAVRARQARIAAQQQRAVTTQNAPPPVANPAAKDPATVKPESNVVRRKQVARPAQPTQASPPPAKTPAKTATSPASSTAASNPEKDNYQSPEPQPIGYWELPDNVRLSVPVIKFSVLVFAEQPDDRFVLINGERFKEGDELRPGLVVEEIRRDGVIFSFRLYRFFVER